MGRVDVMVVVATMVVGLLQPNQPGTKQLVDVVVKVKVVLLAGRVVVVSSKQPHQPGVLHVVVRVRVRDDDDDEEVVVEDDDGVVVVVVLVSVAVFVLLLLSLLEVDVDVVVVVVMDVYEPLLSKYFQLKQSTHSGLATHSGTVS